MFLQGFCVTVSIAESQYSLHVMARKLFGQCSLTKIRALSGTMAWINIFLIFAFETHSFIRLVTSTYGCDMPRISDFASISNDDS